MIDVTAAILIENRRVFLARRGPGEKHAGGWEFPGGKVEPGETPQACLKRELLEELEIEAEVRELLAESIYTYPQGSIRLLAYRVQSDPGEIRLQVHDQYRWVSAEELPGFDLLPADRPIAEFIATRL